MRPNSDVWRSDLSMAGGVSTSGSFTGLASDSSDGCSPRPPRSSPTVRKFISYSYSGHHAVLDMPQFVQPPDINDMDNFDSIQRSWRILASARHANTSTRLRWSNWTTISPVSGDCVVELVALEPTTKVLWNMVRVRPTPLVTPIQIAGPRTLDEQRTTGERDF